MRYKANHRKANVNQGERKARQKTERGEAKQSEAEQSEHKAKQYDVLCLINMCSSELIADASSGAEKQWLQTVTSIVSVSSGAHEMLQPKRVKNGELK